MRRVRSIAKRTEHTQAVLTSRIAIVGNPNTGKTTLFNALTGLRHKVGNYPGVTVERREGQLVGSDSRTTLVDLPGAYSLVSRSADERITRDVLMGLLEGEALDGVVVVLDASYLERHLYLATQIIDLGLPVVLCCNMVDVAQAAGRSVDLDKLAQRLGVLVVGTVANRKLGIEDLRQAILTMHEAAGPGSQLELPALLREEVAHLGDRIRECGLGSPGREQYYALIMLCCAYVETPDVGDDPIPAALVSAVDQSLARLQDQGLPDPQTAIVQARFALCGGLAREVVARQPVDAAPMTDRVDRVLTHPLWGLAVFGLIMFVMFLAIFSWAEPLMTGPYGIESLLAMLGERIANLMPQGMLRSLVVDGIVGGVGAVLVFLPQICILFFFICLLEDTGYMARAALVMNRLMSRIGLPGKSFIPLLSSFACAIPGIMAARTIENQRDRLVTILVAPWMSCSARLPIYVIMIGAVFGANVWLKAGIMILMYALGLAAALAAAFVWKRFVFKTRPPGFIIELPPYRRPQVRVILRAMWERSALFLRDAGSVIFAASIVLWALAYFPRADQAAGARNPGMQLRQSYMGQVGQALEPLIKPLGFDWKIGIGIASSFAAREVFISTMGIVYGVGDDPESTSTQLSEKIAGDTWPDGRRLFTPLVAISLMVFYVLACQCVSTLGVVKRETNTWRWPLLMFGYMTALAYLASLVVFQVGCWLGWNAA